MTDDMNSGNVTCSVPCSPVTTNVHVEPLLNDILLPLMQEGTMEGALTPVQEGQLTPNTEALTLLTGFATGEIFMEGEQLKHLPSISESLETLWESPKRKKNIDGRSNCTKMATIAQKEPRKTISKQLAEKNFRTRIPNSEIKIENIIPGSPVYLPYKRKPIVFRGKGKDSKGSKIVSIPSEFTDMAHTKQTLTKAELEVIKARNKRADTRAKRMADEATKQAKVSILSSSKTRKTDPNAGKAPCKTLQTKAARKSTGGQKPTKPRRNWEMQALHEICRFQKSMDLLIP